MNGKKWGMVMSMIFGVSGAPIQGKIISEPTMKAVKLEIESVIKINKAKIKPADIWVGFDIDMTLIQPDHPAAYYPNLKKYRPLYTAVLGDLTPVQKDIVNTLLVQTIPPRLVEKETSGIVKALQKQGVKTFAFTATLTGKFSKHQNKVIQVRREQLQKIGFDFSEQLTHFPPCLTFTQFKEHAGSHPMFYHGILSSNGEHNPSKGETLVAFLTSIENSSLIPEEEARLPKVIVLIDDRIKNLESVEQHLNAYDPSIVFIGIEYRGAFTYAPKDITPEDFQNFWKVLTEAAKAEGYE